MSGSSRTKWESFFVDAGLPQKQAAEYASTFSNNRMRLDMLEELNKDLLRDLGIKALGDIITIIRHAKQRGNNRSPSPDNSAQLSSKPLDKIKSSISLSTATKTSFTTSKVANKTVQNVRNKPNNPIPVRTAHNPIPVRTAQNPIPVRTAQQTGKTNNTILEKASGNVTTTSRVSMQPIRLGSNRIGTAINKVPDATSKDSDMISTKSSKSGIGKPRLKLSDRFDGFDVESKRMKTDETDVRKQIQGQYSESLKEVQPKTTIGIRTVDIDDRSKARSAPNSFQSSLARDDKKNLVRQQPTGNASKTSPPSAAKPVQFTVQVPSKPPMNKGDPTVPTKPSPTQTKVTIVPAKGKALNRNKQMTSIFDRLDAPPSSSVAAELLNDESLNQKSNVFRRLGLKSDKPKTSVENVNQTDKKLATESVFRRLGTPQSSNL